MENSCKRKTCNKRNRKICRYGQKCTYQKNKSCEFKHESVSVKDQLEKVKEEANKVKTESEALKHQIKELKQTIQNQKNRLENINSEQSKILQCLISKILNESIKMNKFKSKKEIYITGLNTLKLCRKSSKIGWYHLKTVLFK
jgi:predicted nuclease with TOPRIM domain